MLLVDISEEKTKVDPFSFFYRYDECLFYLCRNFEHKQTGTIIKQIREDKGLMQKQVSAHLVIGNSNYNKLENGLRDLSVDKLQKLAIRFNMITDEILNYGNVVPTADNVEGKFDFEKLNLMKQLQEDDKQTVNKIVETMLTKQEFQTFFEQNLQTAK
jgi:transcriptional regulator with XRE-family HTH domain